MELVLVDVLDYVVVGGKVYVVCVFVVVGELG